MKLYKKKLRNIGELNKERRRLLKEKKILDSEPVLSLEEVVGDVKGLGAGLLQNALPLISSFSGPLLGLVTGFFSKMASGKKKKKEETVSPPHHYPPPADQRQEKHSNVLKSVATEVVGSYLKWKALQLSYKGISFVVRRQKAKKAERKAAERADHFDEGKLYH